MSTTTCFSCGDTTAVYGCYGCHHPICSGCIVSRGKSRYALCSQCFGHCSDEAIDVLAEWIRKVPLAQVPLGDRKQFWLRSWQNLITGDDGVRYTAQQNDVLLKEKNKVTWENTRIKGKRKTG